jgi:proteasome lid subunit RPN8/RPN11
MSNQFLPIDIQSSAMNEMKGHGEEAFPNECCGFFYGEEKNGVRMVSLARRIENVKEGDQRRRFEISSKDYFKAERYATMEGLTLLGIYHSHPVHPAIPSEHDLAVAMPWFSYIIVSVEKDGVDHVRSWQLSPERKFEEETIKS